MKNSWAVMEQGQVTTAGSLHGGALGIPLPAASITPTSQPGSIYISWQVIRGLCREV